MKFDIFFLYTYHYIIIIIICVQFHNLSFVLLYNRYYLLENGFIVFFIKRKFFLYIFVICTKVYLEMDEMKKKKKKSESHDPKSVVFCMCV